MKLLLLILAVLLIVNLSCRQEPDARTGRGPQIPKEAYKPLTEDNIALFLRVWPALAQLADSVEYEKPEVTLLDNTASQWAKMIDSLRIINGFEAVLAGLGTDWSSFQAVAYRILVTISAIGYKEAAANLRAGMRYRTPGERAVLRKRMRETKRIVSRVPKTNEDVFKPHERELLDIFYQLQ